MIRLFNIISEEKTKLKMLDAEARNALLTKIAVSVFAVFLGLLFLVISVYLIIPSIISNASDSLDLNRARRMYESTLIYQDSNTEPVFIQPGTKTHGLKPRNNFSVALAENPDVAGRISIDGVGIDYLVMQSKDNELYLRTGYSGDKSRLGSVFLDYRCDASLNPPHGHYIVYGHNIESGAMFHNLLKYKDEDTFWGNRIIRFDTLYNDYSWEIFSAYTTTTDFYYIDTVFKDSGEWLDFLYEIQKKSIFETNTALSPDDAVLTLSTCTNVSDNERFVIHARLVK